MSDRVSVTIGIPFLNARRYLADAVRSVFAQTHGDWELLLIDDGSTDGSIAVVRHLDDPRVRVLGDGSNRGLCARLNQIASLAQGTYLARMDADDLMHPERIERQLKFLRANPNVDLIDTATFTVDDDLTPLGIRGDRPLDSRPEAVLRNGLLIHPTVMGRAEWFRSNPYDPVYVRAEDRELWSRTCATTKFARLCEPLFFYREGPAGNLRNYLRTERTVRDILHRYGPPLVGGRQHTAPGDAFTTQVDGLPHRHETRAARPADQEAKPPAQRGGDTGRSPHSFARSETRRFLASTASFPRPQPSDRFSNEAAA